MPDLQPDVPTDLPPVLHVQRPARPDQAREIRHAVSRYVQGLGCTGDQLDAVTLAVGEAVNNAVSYSAEADGAKVSLCCRLNSARTLTIDIRNSGTGALPDLSVVRTLPDDFAVHGRGFPLMSMLMDEVQIFADRGETVVRLIKRISA